MPNLKTVGVDCEGSILMHYHKTGEICEAKSYVVEGIGEDFYLTMYCLIKLMTLLW